MEDRVERQIAGPRPVGRSAQSNVSGRYERFRYEFEDDGWEPDKDLPALRTTVTDEAARKLITYNRSPDLPFDRSINLFRGCEHGCIYCFARPTHAYLGLSPGLDFETRLFAKPDAPVLLEKELRKSSYKVAPIALGTNTDPYQPVEKKRKLTRACLEVLAEYRHPVAIVTKGSLIERDLDILSPMAKQGLVRVGISVTTLDRSLARLMEPRVPPPRRRLATIQKLHRAGVPVRVMVSPIVPALTDPELEAILQAAHAAGADAASWIMLRLPREVSLLFREWLETHFPYRAARVMARVREMHGGQDYDARWGHRMRGEGHYARMIARRFALQTRRLGLDRPQPALRCDLFKSPPVPGDQMQMAFDRGAG